MNHRKPVTYKKQSLGKVLRRYKYLYLMVAIPLVYYAVFRYAPLMGLQVAFKDYNLFKGMWDSPWVGFKVFREIFSYKKFWRALRNTALLNIYDLLFGFSVPIILAILLYEMRSLRLKRLSQTLLYLPHFLSWVIIGGIVTELFSSTGMVNQLIKRLSGGTVDFLTDPGRWTVVYVATGIWQSAGWSTIIYLAAISSVDTALYEAAEVDGCGRWKRIWYVTLPCIMPTITVMLILQLGRVATIGFERPYVMGNYMVTDVSDVISTFVYTMGIRNARYPFATAVDLFGSLLNLVFLVAANIITKRLNSGEGGLW